MEVFAGDFDCTPTHPLARFTPSGRMMFVESSGKIITAANGFRFRHAGKINEAFMDGHVETMPEAGCSLLESGEPTDFGAFGQSQYSYALIW